jgi:hypothetical protein
MPLLDDSDIIDYCSPTLDVRHCDSVAVVVDPRYEDC